MTEAPAGAPACFAAASVFTHDSLVCRGCEAFNACSAACIDTLEKIRSIVNVDDLLRRHQAAKKVTRDTLRQEDEKRATALPPGNPQPPLPAKPVERKTKEIKVTFEASADEQDVIARLPVKPRELAVRLMKGGELHAMRKDLAEGRNTFAQSGPAFMRVAVQMLLDGGFTKGDLCERFEKELNWTKGTAQSHVGIACPLLIAFGIARPDGARIVANPATA